MPKLSRQKNVESQVLIIPNHKEIKKGTLHSIYKKSIEYLSDEEIKAVFF